MRLKLLENYTLFFRVTLFITINCCILGRVSAQFASFIPSYNDGTQITLAMGDSAIIFSVIKKKKESNIKEECFYYYYNNSQVQKSKGSYIGKPLNKLFVMEGRDGRLIEKGTFKVGLKHRTWRRWHSNGQLESIERWRNGDGAGKKSLYDNSGLLVCQYRWRNDSWTKTRKYAKMEERKLKKAKREAEKLEKKSVKKQAQELEKNKKANLKAQKDAIKAQEKLHAPVEQSKAKKRWFFFKAKTASPEPLVGSVMPNEQVDKSKKIESESKWKKWFGFLKRDSKSDGKKDSK